MLEFINSLQEYHICTTDNLWELLCGYQQLLQVINHGYIKTTVIHKSSFSMPFMS